MDRYDLALLSLLRTLLSKKGSSVLADRSALPGAVAEILAERSNDDIRGILMSAHRLAAGSADRLGLLGELACLLPELSESMMRSAQKESQPQLPQQPVPEPPWAPRGEFPHSGGPALREP